MLCSRTRTALSAHLDGETLPPGVTMRRLQEHLTKCPDCGTWQKRAEELRRFCADSPARDQEAATAALEGLLERLCRVDGERPDRADAPGRHVG